MRILPDTMESKVYRIFLDGVEREKNTMLWADSSTGCIGFLGRVAEADVARLESVSTGTGEAGAALSYVLRGVVDLQFDHKAAAEILRDTAEDIRVESLRRLRALGATDV